MTKTPDERAHERDVLGFLEELRTTFLYCRELGHNWKPWRATLHAGTYERVLRCTRCRTERVQELTASGHLLSNHYRYADGYQSKGLGRLVGDDRDALRMTSLLRFTEKDND